MTEKKSINIFLKLIITTYGVVVGCYVQCIIMLTVGIWNIIIVSFFLLVTIIEVSSQIYAFFRLDYTKIINNTAKVIEELSTKMGERNIIIT